MVRAEIISNQSVQDYIVELLEQEIPGIEYTLIPDIQGKGGKTKKLGDSIWAELNFVLFTYVNEEDAKKIKAIILAVRKHFPKEGLSLFFTKGELV